PELPSADVEPETDADPDEAPSLAESLPVSVAPVPALTESSALFEPKLSLVSESSPQADIAIAKVNASRFMATTIPLRQRMRHATLKKRSGTSRTWTRPGAASCRNRRLGVTRSGLPRWIEASRAS